MATLFRVGPFRILVYTNDHSPAHVHAVGNATMATKTQIARAVDTHLATATAAGAERRARGGHAVSVGYAPRIRRLHIELASGVALDIPAAMIEGLGNAKASVIAKVELIGSGTGLHRSELDLDVSVPDLVAGCFGTKAWMSALARQAGRSTSRAKAEAARRNGKLGGRPRKERPGDRL